MRSRFRPTLAAVAATAVLLVLTACSGGNDQANQGGSSGDRIQAGLELNKKLHNQLPADIKKSGKLTSVMSGAFPPYTIPRQGGQKFTGAAIDLQKALGTVLGVKIKTASVEGLSGTLSGLESGRYDFAMGPIGDYADRRGSHNFVDYVQEFVAFLVPKGNPHHIGSLADTCGLKVAVQAGGSAEAVVKEQSKQCVKDGKEAVNVKSFKDQPSSTLSVKAGRTDAFFSSQAPLVYYAHQTSGQLTVVAKGKPNGFEPIRQGAVMPKGSPLTKIVLQALKEVFQNGTYAKIMKKYGLQDEMLDKPGINLGASHE